MRRKMKNEEEEEERGETTGRKEGWVASLYRDVRNKGQVETGRYRFLAREGGYVWLVTQATLIHGPKDHKPQYVVCLNYVISGIESRGEILSELQLLCSTEDSKSSKKVSPAPVSAPPVLKDIATPISTTPALPPARTHAQHKVCDGVGVPTRRVSPAPPPRPPVANTFKIFTPRTKDMNKGYLTFSKDNPQGTVLKEEPEDLTHLAPSVGDTCVPLLECAPFNSGLEADQCMPREVTSLGQNLDDMFNLDYQMPVANSDVLIASPVPDKTEDIEFSPEYIDDESQLPGGVKCMNSLSGGHLVLRQSECNSPSSSQDSSSFHPSNLGTPEPPKPIFTEAILSPIPHRKFPLVFGASRPRTTTESFFTHLDESQTQGSSPELFGKLDIKLDNQNMDADEFEMRAPYIPYSNEDLVLGPDDLLWGAEPEPSIITKHCTTATRDNQCCNLGLGEKEDSSLAQLLRDTDPTITGGQGRNLHLDNSPGTQRNQYHQSKFLDGGGNFVDPNKVLPGHFARKEEVEGGGRSSRLMDPPPALVQDPVEPPPPLVALDAKQVSSSVKRGRSPLASPTLTHKKMCSQSCQPESNPRQRGEGLGKQGGVRLLTTPYAPTMQQLLVSKEPITVRGGRPGGGLSSTRNSLSDENHSVLRNLLNVSGESSQVVNEGQSGSGGSLHLARDKMATMVVTSGGGGTMGSLLPYSKLSLVTDTVTGMPEGHLTFKLTSTSGSEGVLGGRRSHRQDPLLLMNPDTTITNLLDLTQQDCEVNAPANNCNLLQGADLLMALDQSL
ncbi:hypothetical protein Pmani_032342 [Petrolisthes manimaculis]|uniref:HIF-1 alpha C-terminal transactivation domain-containing protein n=1 Tax=Petrolisthes manimaculis TaxID=1843537 RepID=A0AAE1TTV8_9EUCA|nr:hypothetical protein Pmani_032342 [Petrolisthes manimaculis]